MRSLLVCLFILLFLLAGKSASSAFSPSNSRLIRRPPPHPLHSAPMTRPFGRLYENRDNDDRDMNHNSDNNSDDNFSLLDRFFNPKIDDPALLLSEAGLAQIVAPALQLFWLLSLHSPYPSWARPLTPISDNNDGALLNAAAAARGSFLAPTLIHGAGLACCWLAGCLAARAFEKNAIEGEWSQVLLATLKAGAFACGLLILATQFDLYIEQGGHVVQVGDSPETDQRIYLALVEVINDIVFEAITLIPWRLYRSTITMP